MAWHMKSEFGKNGKKGRMWNGFDGRQGDVRGVGMKLCAVLLLLTAWCAGELAGQETATGIRTWRFTDGAQLRARFKELKDGVVAFSWTADNPKIALDRLVPEHRTIVESLASGAIRRADHIGIDTFPEDEKVRGWVKDFINGGMLFGEDRKWKKSDGKTAVGALCNITDDEIHIFIQGAVWKIAVSDLSPEDLDYLEGIRNREELVFPRQMRFPFFPVDYDSAKFEGNSWIPWERFADAKTTRLTFEQITADAVKKLSGKVDPKYWVMRGVEEQPIAISPGIAKNIPHYTPVAVRKAYRVSFELEEHKIAAGRKAFPGCVDEGGRCHFVYLDDGLAPEFSVTPKSK